MHDTHLVPTRGVHAGLGFAECTARVVAIADDELTVDRAYLKEHEQVQAHGWVYYAFNVTDEDYQVVVNVAEEEDSQCKLPTLHEPTVQTHMYSTVCLPFATVCKCSCLWSVGLFDLLSIISQQHCIGCLSFQTAIAGQRFSDLANTSC